MFTKFKETFGAFKETLSLADNIAFSDLDPPHNKGDSSYALKNCLSVVEGNLSVRTRTAVLSGMRHFWLKVFWSKIRGILTVLFCVLLVCIILGCLYIAYRFPLFNNDGPKGWAPSVALIFGIIVSKLVPGRKIKYLVESVGLWLKNR